VTPTPWFSRRLRFDVPPEDALEVVERLAGAPGARPRAEALVASVPEDRLARRVGGT